MRLNLFTQPTDYHAAGLAGLAAVLEALAPHWGGPPPWHITADQIECDDDPTVIRRVAREALRLDSAGVIAITGTWDERLPRPVRARLHCGLLETVYHHHKSHSWAGENTELPPAPVPGPPGAEVAVPYRPLASYLPQRLEHEWKSKQHRIRFASLLPNYPAASPPETQRSDWVLPLYFLPAGSFALPLPSDRSVHVVPLVGDLTQAGALLRAALPASLPDCYPASAADAALATQLRLRAAGIEPVQVTARTYKPRGKHHRGIGARDVAEPSPEVLDSYARVAQALPTRAWQRSDTGRWFLAPSPTRGAIAANLLAGRRWYEGVPDRVSWEELRRDGQGIRTLLLEG
ncbi:MAG: hypothetical protein IRY99_20990 [Isosphaeraceae bacterium]|nr:hypothetical protein [Isosphaeraceae bacterium]